MDSSVLEKSTQHIKDFKLAIEFKYLMKHAPAGVYLMPEVDNIRRLHGAIFVRRGLYRDGVFRFVIELPQNYNDVDTHPVITFTPPVFNPLIDPSTGVLDLRIDEYLKQWQPERHFIVTAITFLKRIFYMKSYDNFSSVPNEEAKSLFQNDKAEFWNRVNAAVDESLQRIHAVPADSKCTMLFTEPKPVHDDIIKKVLFRPAGEQTGGADAASVEGGASSANEGDRAEEEADIDEDSRLGKEVVKRDDDELGASRDYGSASSDFGLSPSAVDR